MNLINGKQTFALSCFVVYSACREALNTHRKLVNELEKDCD